MKLARIITKDETPHELLERVINAIFSVERSFKAELKHTKRMAEEFAGYIVGGYLMLGIPILMNAGKHHLALSSCTVIPVDLREADSLVEERIDAYYRHNMGSGFDFTPYDNPVELLNWINEFSAKKTAMGSYIRNVGNMGILHVSHPRVREFIQAKRSIDANHFNISINVNEKFMCNAEMRENYILSSGEEVNASSLLDQIAENAWLNGEPGLVFLERMNKDNPLIEVSEYVSVPPCAEMGLAEGEICHFGYINLEKFVKLVSGRVQIDYATLDSVTRLLTRALDNTIEYSLPRYPTSLSVQMAQMKRRIGIGICGLAEMLLAHRLPYESEGARSLARDVLSFINYTSKCASVELAYERGPCFAMGYPQANRYLNGRYLEEKYASNPTRTISSQAWKDLADTIRTTGKLRNISTTTLPPSGIASILLGVTPSLEPLFNIFERNGDLNKRVIDFLKDELGENIHLLEQICEEARTSGSFQSVDLPISTRDCLKTAKEIDAKAQLQMVADLASLKGVVDESASKTINLPNRASIGDVREIFLLAYRLLLKNIAVYRDKTRGNQPSIL